VKPEGAPVEGESKKEKKAKAAAAVAAAESAKSDTTVSIPVEAVAVIGEGGGVTGGEGVKKVKAPKEKKVQPPVVPESAPAPWMIDLRVGTIIDGPFFSFFFPFL
jgi:aminoacyl tRNA synthase complex-interacting multifunctional protein 1